MNIANGKKMREGQGLFSKGIFPFSRPGGQAMILTIVSLGGTILGAVTIAGLLLTYQIRQASDLAGSARAIFAADAGIEWSIYRYFKQDPSMARPQFLNGAQVTIACSNALGATIDCMDDDVAFMRSRGNSGNVSRSFELSL
jgi:hypothetical protein